jgi:hypothetical protein
MIEMTLSNNEATQTNITSLGFKLSWSKIQLLLLLIIIIWAAQFPGMVRPIQSLESLEEVTVHAGHKVSWSIWLIFH